jgi:fructokinase
LAAVKAVQEKARQCGTRIALSLSDPNIVNYFRGPIEELVGGEVDLLFANEEEAKCLAQVDSLEEAVLHLKKVAREFAVTCGPKGALIYDGRVLHRIPPVPTQAVDTLGAGDMFAGAFLYGITHGMPPAQAGALASAASSLLVANWGPRLKVEQTQGVLQQHLAGRSA